MATFEYATPIFKLNGTQIYLLHVLDENALGRKSKSVKCLNQNSRDATNYALKQLNILENRYLSKCGEIKKVVRCGEPYKEIVRFANENKIDLILISTRGRTGILRALMGSVAEKVVRYSSVPVLTVKPDKVQIKLMEQEDIDKQLHLKPNIKKINQNNPYMFNVNKGTTMKYTFSLLVLVALTVFLVLPGAAEEKASNKFIGVKKCSMCHKSDAKGNQSKVWSESKHSKAYTVLSSDAALKIAKGKGLKKPAIESPECLSCHTITADVKLLDKTFDVKDGVQCESCHGAGSAYQSMSVMKEKAKAIVAGLIEFKDEAAKEKYCKTCHNEKSPTFKEFKFKEMWGKVRHPIKKS